MSVWTKVKLGLLVALVFVTFTLGVKVTRDHYRAREQAARIEALQKDISARDVSNKILRDAAVDQQRQVSEASERIRQYEAYLRTRPGDCAINSDDLRWMRSPRRTPAAPAR